MTAPGPDASIPAGGSVSGGLAGATRAQTRDLITAYPATARSVAAGAAVVADPIAVAAGAARPAARISAIAAADAVAGVRGPIE
ncbi:hypothetical protein [Mycobacterium conspicuum]|uniref:hypothetical protein n=1 Tax=Mycobacterium conspicuum TaxID=44010 RepID=UPI0021F27B0D|nr:hypothetical protein [Mycobacterium conspicuum]